MISQYQSWLKHVFDHEVKTPQWHFENEAPDFSASPEEIAKLIGQTFSRAGQDLISYTDSQVNQGIWYIASPSCSDFMFALKSAEAPIEIRLTAIGNIFNLYADCFAKRCTESLSHLEEEASDLNPICYMFWDVCPISYLEGVPDERQTQDAVFSVLERTLALEHRACREGALHGLGEMTCWSPERTGAIIDQFIKNRTLDEKLLAYAQKAREGDIL